MQETEINKNFDHNLLSFPEFVIEMERNSACSRVAILINTGRRDSTDGRAGTLYPGTCEVPGSNPGLGDSFTRKIIGRAEKYRNW